MLEFHKKNTFSVCCEVWYLLIKWYEITPKNHSSDEQISDYRFFGLNKTEKFSLEAPAKGFNAAKLQGFKAAQLKAQKLQSCKAAK